MSSPGHSSVVPERPREIATPGAEHGYVQGVPVRERLHPGVSRLRSLRPERERHRALLSSLSEFGARAARRSRDRSCGQAGHADGRPSPDRPGRCRAHQLRDHRGPFSRERVVEHLLVDSPERCVADGRCPRRPSVLHGVSEDRGQRARSDVGHHGDGPGGPRTEDVRGRPAHARPRPCLHGATTRSYSGRHGEVGASGTLAEPAPSGPIVGVERLPAPRPLRAGGCP